MNALVELGLLFKFFSLKDKVNSSSTSIHCILNFKKSSRYFSRWRIITMKTIFPVCSRGTNNYLQLTICGQKMENILQYEHVCNKAKTFWEFYCHDGDGMVREWKEDAEKKIERGRWKKKDSKGQKKRKKLGILTVNCKKLGRFGSFMREVLSSVPSVLNSIGMAMYRNQH